MDPNKLKPQKKYFIIYFGRLRVLTYVGHDASYPSSPFLFWMERSQRIQGYMYSHSFTRGYVEQDIWELSRSFEEFILLFT